MTMMKNGKSSSVVINLDGQDVEVPAGINLVEAASLHGTEVPHYCYHPKLSVAGNCRMCLVEMGTPMRDRATGEAILDEHGKQKIGWLIWVEFLQFQTALVWILFYETS